MEGDSNFFKKKEHRILDSKEMEIKKKKKQQVYVMIVESIARPLEVNEIGVASREKEGML